MKLTYFKLDVSPFGMSVEVHDRDIASGIMQKVHGIVGPIDDAGSDWLTDNFGYTYIGTKDWRVSDSALVAKMVDTANYIRYGQELKIEGGA